MTPKGCIPGRGSLWPAEDGVDAAADGGGACSAGAVRGAGVEGPRVGHEEGRCGWTGQ